MSSGGSSDLFTAGLPAYWFNIYYWGFKLDHSEDMILTFLIMLLRQKSIIRTLIQPIVLRNCCLPLLLHSAGIVATLLLQSIESEIMDGFGHSRCLNNLIKVSNIIRSLLGHYWVIIGLFWVIIGSLSGHYWVIIRSLSGHYLFLIRSLLGHYGVIIGSLLCHYWVIIR